MLRVYVSLIGHFCPVLPSFYAKPAIEYTLYGDIIMRVCALPLDTARAERRGIFIQIFTTIDHGRGALDRGGCSWYTAGDDRKSSRWRRENDGKERTNGREIEQR